MEERKIIMMTFFDDFMAIPLNVADFEYVFQNFENVHLLFLYPRFSPQLRLAAIDHGLICFQFPKRLGPVNGFVHFLDACCGRFILARRGDHSAAVHHAGKRIPAFFLGIGIALFLNVPAAEMCGPEGGVGVGTLVENHEGFGIVEDGIPVFFDVS